MSAGPGNHAEPRHPVPPPRPGSPDGPVLAGASAEPAGRRLPAVFAAEVYTAVRYERGLAVKAVIVLAALAAGLLLRALYFG
jgi:hypothetical protein